MGTQQQQAWFKPWPIDADRKAFADWKPIGVTLTCGRLSANLTKQLIPHAPCSQPRGHEGRCLFEAL